MPEKTRITLRSLNENIQEILRILESVQTGLGTVQNKLESFQTETRGDFARIDTQIDRMSHQVARIPEIESRLKSLESEMRAVRIRLDNLEGLYQHLDKRLEILDHEYVSMTAALKRLEERFDNLEADRLKERVRILEERVAVLEKNRIN